MTDKVSNSMTPRQVKKLDKKLDKQTIKFGENGQEQKLSIFSEGTVVTNDTKAVLGKYDKNHDGKLDKEEVVQLKNDIYKAAGDDKVLTDAEFAQMMGVKQDSKEFKNYRSQLDTAVTRQSKGESQSTVSNKNGSKTVSNFKADGSGTEVTTGKDKNGNPVKTTVTYGQGGVKQKAETHTANETISSTYVNNEQGKPTIIKTTVSDAKTGKLKKNSEEKFQYDNNGNRISSESTVTDSKGKTVSKTQSNYEYTNGKLSKSTTQKQDANGSSKTVSTYDPKTGKISTANTEKINVDKNGNKTKTNCTTNYEYSQDGKLQKQSTKGVDANGKPYEIIDTFGPDGKTKTGRTRTYYKGESLRKDTYDGTNLENRTKGNVPTESVVYEADGKTIKEKIVNKFDENGVVIGQETYDKDNKLVDTKDFSKLDGHYDVSYQKNRGDCYLLASINSLAQTQEGQKLMKENVKEIKDDKGNVVAYEVSFPGAEQTRQDIINGKYDKEFGGKVPADKVHIKGTYTVTKEELDAAAQKEGVSYSVGDKDVLLTEVAYEKYRADVVKTHTDNGLNPADKKQNLSGKVPGMGVAAEKVAEGDYLSGGTTDEATYVLTGKKANKYSRNSKEVPTCYISQPDLQMSIPSDQKNKLSDEKVNDPNLDKTMQPVIKDCKDGKLDNYSVSVSFNVSQQEVNGKVVQGGGHAFSVKSMTEDKVVLANPWNPEEDIVMSMEDFKRSVKSVEFVPLKTGNSNTSQTEQTGGSGQSGNVGNTGSTTSNQPAQKSNYTVPKGKGYKTMIKEALISQGIPATPENIQKAQAQFEKENPGAVHIYNGSNTKWRGNKFLMENAKVFIPNFNFE
ncbi:hypothetical protein IJ541_06785 [bacterium]|nr:hypothetical protein [bacterium]